MEIKAGQLWKRGHTTRRVIDLLRDNSTKLDWIQYRAPDGTPTWCLAQEFEKWAKRAHIIDQRARFGYWAPVD